MLRARKCFVSWWTLCFPVVAGENSPTVLTVAGPLAPGLEPESEAQVHSRVQVRSPLSTSGRQIKPPVFSVSEVERVQPACQPCTIDLLIERQTLSSASLKQETGRYFFFCSREESFSCELFTRINRGE